MFEVLEGRIAQLERHLNDLRRVTHNMIREAKILETYPEEGTYVVEAFGEGSKSKKMPMFQQSGAIKDFVPYSVGQHVTMICPGGDPGRGFLMPGGYTEEFEQPHNKDGEARRTIGDSSDLMTGGARKINAGEVTVDGGSITLTAGSGHLA